MSRGGYQSGGVPSSKLPAPFDPSPTNMPPPPPLMPDYCSVYSKPPRIWRQIEKAARSDVLSALVHQHWLKWDSSAGHWVWTGDQT